MTRTLRKPRLRVRTILVLVAALAVLLAAWNEFANPVRRWRRALRDDNDSARRWAAVSLGVLGQVPGIDVRTALQELCAALGDPSFRVRQTSCNGLGTLGAAAEPAIPALAGVVENDRDHAVRAAAVMALGEVLRNSGTTQGRGVAVPALTRTLNDRSFYVRFEAAVALVTIGEGERTVPVLIEGLNNRDDATLGQACWALGKLGQGAGPAIPALLAFVGDFDSPTTQYREYYRRQALGVLVNLGQKEAIRRTLEHAGDGGDPSTRQAAQELMSNYLDVDE